MIVFAYSGLMILSTGACRWVCCGPVRIRSGSSRTTPHKKPTHMYILSEWMGSFRQIFLDGRKHPAELEPTWFGHCGVR
jgi:hypothetical protein